MVNLNKGYTLRVLIPNKQHRGVDVKFWHAATLKDLDVLLAQVLRIEGAQAMVLGDKRHWVKAV